jgi:outer membrane protein TolC
METELQSSLLNVFSYAGSVLNTGLSLAYSERHFEYVMERYRLSQSSISDLNEASTLLINNRNNLIKARYGFLQGLSKLRSLGAFADEERLIEILMKNS